MGRLSTTECTYLPTYLSFPLEGSAGIPRFTQTVWFVPPSHLIPAGSSFTYSPGDEPW